MVTYTKRRGEERCREERRGVERRGEVQRGEERCREERRGVARRGEVWRGVEWKGVERRRGEERKEMRWVERKEEKGDVVKTKEERRIKVEVRECT